jgi:hypothetical protein
MRSAMHRDSLFRRTSSFVRLPITPTASVDTSLTTTRQYGGPGSSDAQRKAAGAKSSPFSGTLASLGGGKKVATPNSAWTSPEDTTNACSTQGGIGTLIAPVLAKHNTGMYFYFFLTSKSKSNTSNRRGIESLRAAQHE